MFYDNNYIKENQFIQLYKSNSIATGMRNKDAIAHIFIPASTKTTKIKLEIARNKRHKTEKEKKKGK